MPGADLFQIDARDGEARAGVLRTGARRGAHAGVRPARLHRHGQDAALGRGRPALGFEMVLGNTFHLFIQPGPRAHRRAGRAARVHGLAAARSSRTPGGFQVFSMGHGSVAEEIKRSRGDAASRGSSRSRRRACASAPTSTAASASWGRRPRWRSRPRSAPTSPSPSTSARPSTWTASTRRARWSAPTAGSTAASPGTASTRRPGQLLFGIVQGGVYEDLRAESAALRGAPPTWTAWRSAARSARRRSRCARWSAGRCASSPTSGRATCSASATWTTSCTPWAPASTASTAPRPPAWPATARRSCRTRSAAGGSTSRRPARATSREPIADGLPLPRLPRPHARPTCTTWCARAS